MQRQVSILLIGQMEEDIFFKNAKVENSDETGEIVVFRDGETAISYLNKESNFSDKKLPGLIIIDFDLPGIDGMGLLQHIKKNSLLKSIPVIILSDFGSNEKVINYYQNRANCVINRSLNFNDKSKLLRTIKDFWFNIVQLPTIKDK